MAPLLRFFGAALLALDGVLAHPGQSVAEEALERSQFMKRGPRSVRSCAASLQERGHSESAIKRRQALVNKVRVKRGLAKNTPILGRRDFSQYNSSHLSSKNVKFGDDETELFADDSSCVLMPEVTQGPYYVDGELIRSNIVEDQEGVPLFLDVQLIDSSTCEPVPAVFVDFWHANTTGVYSGVSASGNGNSATIKSNLDATFLRGIQQTDSNGVVQIETIVPGHYTGRATHIHVMSYQPNGTVVRTNSTLLGSNATAHVSHVGQIFFDQSLLTQVSKLEPYSTNTQEVTLNAMDDILLSETDVSDPFIEYVFLGDKLSDGLLGWVSIGIDPTADNEISSAATHYKNYGVANENNDLGGGQSGGPPSGVPSGAPPSGAPSGAMPSGTMAA